MIHSLEEKQYITNVLGNTRCSFVCWGAKNDSFCIVRFLVKHLPILENVIRWKSFSKKPAAIFVMEDSCTKTQIICKTDADSCYTVVDTFFSTNPDSLYNADSDHINIIISVIEKFIKSLASCYLSAFCELLNKISTNAVEKTFCTFILI